MSIQELLEYDLGKLKTITVDEIIIVNDPIQPRNGITLAYFNANVPSGGGNMNFLESGTAIIGQHYKSAGTSGDDCVKSSMLEDSVSITFGGLDLSLIGTMTADTIVKTGGLSTQYLMADGSVTTGGSGSSTLANAGAGQSLVANGVPPSLSTKSISAGTGITLTPTATNITISATGGSGNMNYVGSPVSPGTHYIAQDATGLNANASVLVEDPEKINFNGERIYMPNPTTFAGANYMLKMRGISNTSYEQYGIHIEGLTAFGSAYGILVQDVDGDSTIGQFWTNIHAKNDCTGIYAQDIRSDVAQATGMYFQTIQGETDCQGLHMTTVISNTGNSYGVRLDTINSPNANAYGISLNGLQGKGESSGIRLITVNSDSGKSYGTYIEEVTASSADAYGHLTQTIVSGSASAHGIRVDGIQGAINAEAFATKGVNAKNGLAFGTRIESVYTDGKESYGVYVNGVNAPAGNGYGVLLQNIAGSRQYGFYQRGALNVGNIFDSFVDCGGSTANTDPPAVNVRGSINTETQFFTTASATATVNGGNILICSGGTITTLKLPASPPDGLSYQLWKPSTLPLTIDGGAILINGAATQAIATGSPANPSNASLTYSANLAQWLFHLN